MKKNLFLLTILLIMGTISANSQEKSDYYFSSIVEGDVEAVTDKVKAALKVQGFGVVTELDMDKTLEEKLEGVEVPGYKILGVCNPSYAYQTMQAEENIGLFLPCKVLVKEVNKKTSEVVMVNPNEVMRMLGNEKLMETAQKVTLSFKKALNELH